MNQSRQSLRVLFQRHIEKEMATLPSRSAEHQGAIGNCIQKFAKTGDRCLSTWLQFVIRQVGFCVGTAKNLRFRETPLS